MILAASFALALAWLIVPAQPAAAGAYCYPSRCYSELEGLNTTYYGMSGTWNRANMSTPSSINDLMHVSSEMWFLNGNCAPSWVEEGLRLWFDPNLNTGAYESFWGYGDTNGNIASFTIAAILPNASTTDNYQISRTGTPNVFNVWWDGHLYNTPNVGFSSGACLQMGAEIYSTNGHADTFNMYGKAINTSYQFGNWAGQGGVITDTQQLNGFSYQNSEWSWNTRT